MKGAADFMSILIINYITCRLPYLLVNKELQKQSWRKVTCLITMVKCTLVKVLISRLHQHLFTFR